ncbi:MAG: DUF4340 domain-containing protein [Chloroflexi bacterium]|nr:DUF4340 domain-containing protein [Chloroflexota bacterium]
MRLNRGTLILLVVSVIVIAAVLVLNSQPASAPAPTPEATAEGAGPLFPDVTEDALVRFEAINNGSGEKTVLTRDEGGVWTVAEATNTSDLATDQDKAKSVVGLLVGLAATDSFTTESPTDFGLDAPTHTYVLTDKDGAAYTLKIGNKSPTTPRYYALVGDDTATVYVLPQDQVDNLARQMITVPPYVASPTPTPTATRTPNPYSEVEQTATAAVEQTLAAEMLTATAEATLEATPEATAEATP